MVRIYCLTSFDQIKAENPQNAENTFDFSTSQWENNEILTPEKIKKNLHTLMNYQLTEISIGYDFTNDTNKRVYLMYIFRKDSDLLVIKMVPNAVKFCSISSTEFDLIIATSMLFCNEMDYDIRIRVRCIKNTKTRGVISAEEQQYYEDYASNINAFCNGDKILREAAIEAFPFKLPKSTRNNVLRQKLSDISTLVKLLCDPKTGCATNVQADQRYNQKIKCLLKNEQQKNAKFSKTRCNKANADMTVILEVSNQDHREKKEENPSITVMKQNLKIGLNNTFEKCQKTNVENILEKAEKNVQGCLELRINEEPNPNYDTSAIQLLESEELTNHSLEISLNKFTKELPQHFYQFYDFDGNANFVPHNFSQIPSSASFAFNTEQYQMYFNTQYYQPSQCSCNQMEVCQPNIYDHFTSYSGYSQHCINSVFTQNFPFTNPMVYNREHLEQMDYSLVTNETNNNDGSSSLHIDELPIAFDKLDTFIPESENQKTDDSNNVPSSTALNLKITRGRPKLYRDERDRKEARKKTLAKSYQKRNLERNLQKVKIKQEIERIEEESNALKLKLETLRNTVENVFNANKIFMSNEEQRFKSFEFVKRII